MARGMVDGLDTGSKEEARGRKVRVFIRLKIIVIGHQ